MYALSHTGVQQASEQTQGGQCAKEAFRGLQFPSHFLCSLLKTRGPDVAGCHLLCNEGNPLHMIMDWRCVFIHLLYSSILITVFHLSCWISDQFYNLVVLTPHCMYSRYTCRVLEASRDDMMYLSAQHTLLSGWELVCPFRGLLTQPFMSHSDGQTTTMTLPPSSSHSSSSSSRCTHIVPSLRA